MYLRVRDLRLRALILSLSRRQLAFRRLERRLVRNALLRLQMLRRRVIRGLCLHQRGLRRVQVASGDRAFLKQLLACIHNVLIQIQVCLCLRHIKLGLLVLLWHLRLRCRRKCRLCRRVSAAIVQRRRRKVAVLEHRQQLASLHVRAALHIEVTNGRGDLRRDGGLRQRCQDCIGRDMLRDCAHRRMLRLYRHHRCRRGFALVATGQ